MPSNIDTTTMRHVSRGASPRPCALGALALERSDDAASVVGTTKGMGEMILRCCVPTLLAQSISRSAPPPIITWVEIAVVVILVIWLVRGNLYERLQSLEWSFWRASGLAARESSPTLDNLPAAATYQPTDGLRCGACGYSVRGATGLTCSECGADYRVVGMKSGDSAKSFGALPIAIIWGIVVLLIADPINDVIESAMYVQTQTGSSRAEYLAASKAFTLGIAADITESQYGFNRFQPTGKYSDDSLITITFTGSMGQVATLLLHPGREGHERAEPDGSHLSSTEWPSEETIHDCLTSIGVDPKDPAHMGEAQTVVNLVNGYRSGIVVSPGHDPPFYDGSQSGNGIDSTHFTFLPRGPYSYLATGSRVGTPPWVIIGLRLFWLTLWTLGIITVQRRLRWK